MTLVKPVALPDRRAATAPSVIAPGLAAPCVLAFVRPPARPASFSFRDRLEIERWSQAAADGEIGRVRVETSEGQNPSSVGDFLLIYAKDDDWARWGLAPREDSLFELWSMADFATIGCYRVLAEALAQVACV